MNCDILFSIPIFRVITGRFSSFFVRSSFSLLFIFLLIKLLGPLIGLSACVRCAAELRAPHLEGGCGGGVIYSVFLIRQNFVS
jgi:hypothetical protein